MNQLNDHAGIGHDAGVVFDHGKTEVPFQVHWPAFENEVHLSGEHFQKALGVGSSTLNNISGISISTCTNHHPSDPVGITIKEGRGDNADTLPTTSRVIGLSPGSDVVASHAVVPAGSHNIDVHHEFCHTVSRGNAKTEYVHPSALTTEDHARNATRALKWNQHIGVTEEQLDEHVVIAEKDGVTRVALPMDASAGPLGQLVSNKTAEERAVMFPEAATAPTEFENPKLGATVPHIIMTKENWDNGKKTFVQNMKPKFGHNGLTFTRQMVTGVNLSHPLDVKLTVHRRPHPICLEADKFKSKTLHDASELAGVPIHTALSSANAPESAKEDIVAAAIFGAAVGDGVSTKQSAGATIVGGLSNGGAAADPVVPTPAAEETAVTDDEAL